MSSKTWTGQKINVQIESDESSQDSTTNPDEIAFAKERQKMSFQEEKWFYWVRVSFLLMISILTFSTVFIYLLHLFLPTYWRWLSSEDIAQVRDLAITIIVGLTMSTTTTYFFKKK